MSADVSILLCECVQMFISICPVIISFRLWGSDVVCGGLSYMHECMNSRFK